LGHGHAPDLGVFRQTI